MVLGLLADNDVLGHFHAVMTICRHGPWQEFWDAVQVETHTFKELGLPATISDADLWHFCQERNIVLFTGNRNRESDESLEATIERYANEKSLPVLTVADAERLIFDRSYAERVAVKLLETLFDLEQLRGSGRLFLP